MSIAYIGFGANLGARERAFSDALAELNRTTGVDVVKKSHLYETKPVGLSDDGPPFLNAVIEVETALEPFALFRELKRIERELGKSRDHRSDLSRKIDLDLLMYDNKIIDHAELKIPHPRMHARAFVLAPFSEIAPEVVHPILKCTVESLANRLPEADLVGVKIRA